MAERNNNAAERAVAVLELFAGKVFERAPVATRSRARQAVRLFLLTIPGTSARAG